MNYQMSKPKLDWLTFSLPAGRFDPRATDDFDRELNEWARALVERYPLLLELDNVGADMWRFGGSVRPYPLSLENPQTGARIGFGGQHEQCTVWLSGAACQELRASGNEAKVLAWLADEALPVSRVDIAVDFDTSLSLNALAATICGGLAESQTLAVTESKTGQTIAFGSRKSARYTRLYQYKDNPLRPLPRLEFEIKGKSARAALWKLNNFGIERLFETLVKKAGMNLELGIERGLLPVLDLERKAKPSTATKLAWLRNQVVPAIRRMVDEKQITPTEIIELIFKA